MVQVRASAIVLGRAAARNRRSGLPRTAKKEFLFLARLRTNPHDGAEFLSTGTEYAFMELGQSQICGPVCVCTCVCHKSCPCVCVCKCVCVCVCV